MLARWLCCRGQEKTGLTKEAQASRRGTEPETAMQETHPRQELQCRKQQTAMQFLKLRLQFLKLCLQFFEKTVLVETALAVFKTALQFVDENFKISCVFNTSAPKHACSF